jgi:hypothetical protein
MSVITDRASSSVDVEFAQPGARTTGENNKDKNECAQAVASSFALIGMTQQEGLESYQELYDNSRPT